MQKKRMGEVVHNIISIVSAFSKAVWIKLLQQKHSLMDNNLSF